MSITAAGTQLGTNVSFNAGTMDINGYELAVLQDITVSIDYATKEIRQLGSIIMATAPKRHGFKAGAKAKVKSINRELWAALLGSSTPDGTGIDITTIDGQNVLTACRVTAIVNEDPTKSVQFQFSNAILAGAFSLGLKVEDAAETDIEIQAQNVTVVTNF